MEAQAVAREHAATACCYTNSMITSSHAERLARARCSLRGLAIGDALGGFFEFSHGALSRRITQRQLPTGIWHWTDDTQMALSIRHVQLLVGLWLWRPDARRFRQYGRPPANCFH